MTSENSHLHTKDSAPFSCHLCPWQCGVDRQTRLGVCGVPSTYLIARAAPHYDEEPIISGCKGAGNIFFAGCTLRCLFCQNAKISQERFGFALSEDDLIATMLRLQDQGVENIGLVTADHYLHRLPATLRKAKAQGLTLPIALNTSSYLCVSSLRALEGLIDVYVPDLKYISDVLANKYSRAPHYFSYARQAIEEMFRQVGTPVLTPEGLLARGLLVRHLALPGCGEDSKAVISYLGEHFGTDIYFSLMSQYFPTYQARSCPDLNRRLSQEEYDILLDACDAAGLDRGFRQDLGHEDESQYVPNFDGTGLPPGCQPYQRLKAEL